ncbi:MAG: amidohydrolase family protein [Synoicihabitans sp.]
MIDSHQHFWHYCPEDYGWIDDKMAVIRRDFLPADLQSTAANLGVTGSVAVQARQSLVESRWLLELAADDDFIKGVVGWVPLAEASVADDLAALAEDARFKGVRHVVQGEPDPAFLTRPNFNAGIREVTKLDLVYDILIMSHQLPAAITFVDQHPQQRFVLDHIAKPVIAGPPPAEWSRHIKELARRENVSCKFSGVVTEVVGETWDDALLLPYWDTVLEAFGPARLMFGSDWPVCLVRSSYERWLSFVRDRAANLSEGERAMVLGDSARHAYGL